MSDTQTPITMPVLPPIPMAMYMTLRDYFAAKVMQGLLDSAMGKSEIAKVAYAMADAMLKAREE